jgi:hypothetical protein
VTGPDAPLPPPRPTALLESRVSSQGGGSIGSDSQGFTVCLACSCHVSLLWRPLCPHLCLSGGAGCVGMDQWYAAGVLKDLCPSTHPVYVCLSAAGAVHRAAAASA